jgi:hypothetical protein
LLVLKYCLIIKNPAPKAAGSKKIEVKTDADSVLEMQRINEQFEELDNRLNVLLGNILVN